MKHLYFTLILVGLPFVATSHPFEVLDISPVPGDHFIQHYAQYISPNSGGQNSQSVASSKLADGGGNFSAGGGGTTKLGRPF